MLAPICLFTYNRLPETQQTVEALLKNYLAKQSDLFVFSDGPKNESSKIEVEAVREFLKKIKGFKSVQIFESKANNGLAKSIISGVTQIINQYDKVIVLEDDLITTPNFLNFMNQALDFYCSEKKIFSISGYTMDLPSLKGYQKDFYLGYRASSWGWGTWKDRWKEVDWDAEDYFKVVWNPFLHYRFMRGGSDMPYMLWKQMHGKIDSWAIRWCYYQFKKDLLTIFPRVSKLKSIGFGEAATNTKKTQRFNTITDNTDQIQFQFSETLIIDQFLIKEHSQKYSVLNRLKDKF